MDQKCYVMHKDVQTCEYVIWLSEKKILRRVTLSVIQEKAGCQMSSLR